MNNIKEVFTYENTELSIIKKDDDIWFKAKTVAEILEYKDTQKAIQLHVDDEDKKTLKSITVDARVNHPGTKNDHMIYINESGLYSLILRSKLEKAKEFQRWVTKEVLPLIRKTGKYEFNNKQFKMLTFNIQSEYDLQKKVVNFIKNRHPKALLNATLGENQTTDTMRLRSYNMGYQKVHQILLFQICIKIIQVLSLNLKIQKVMVNYQNIKKQCYKSIKTIISKY